MQIYKTAYEKHTTRKHYIKPISPYKSLHKAPRPIAFQCQVPSSLHISRQTFSKVRYPEKKILPSGQPQAVIRQHRNWHGIAFQDIVLIFQPQGNSWNLDFCNCLMFSYIFLPSRKHFYQVMYFTMSFP